MTQTALTQAEVDAWKATIQKMRNINFSSSTSYVDKWTSEEARLREALLRKLNADSAANARTERVEENTETLISATARLQETALETNAAVLEALPLLRELHRVNVLGELPTRAPDQTASARRGVVMGHIRRPKRRVKRLGQLQRLNAARHT